MVDSGLIDVEIGLKYSPASTNRLLEIRTFAGKLSENVTLSLETDTTEAMSTGVFHASARYGSVTPVPPSLNSWDVGWLGIGTMLNAILIPNGI
ncbi:hypothetical protein BC332_23220 [Capsicum chinense]|nr:hypothetical protein BC332_23220 [Capsicum chinense]